MRGLSRGGRVAAAITTVTVVAACGVSGSAVGEDSSSADGAEQAVQQKNVIFFLVDDLSPDLLTHMDTVSGLADGGTTFDNYLLSNSLCCPSRASMFTGEFPHNNGVLANKGPNGGYGAFKRHENRTYATALREAGYRTGYLGKYINEYQLGEDDFHVPAGWSEWHVADSGGYNEYDYNITDYTGGDKTIGDGGGKYLVDLLGERALGFLERSRADGKPFFLQVAPFSPHSGVRDKGPRFPAAKRDRPGGEFPHGDCGGVDCADIDLKSELGKAFDENTGDKPDWVRRQPLTGEEKRELRKDLRDRVRMVQAIDDMVERVLAGMSERERSNTYVMFGTDNGFHLGEHRLLRGKSTAYDHDVRVPLIVKRPDGASQERQRRAELAQNVDLYATFLDIARADHRLRDSRDGRSLLPLIDGSTVADWRDAALIEHVQPSRKGPGIDPDAVSPKGNAQPPTYDAIRTRADLLVNYRGVEEFEYYDLRHDPHQLTNKPRHARVGELKGPLAELAACGQEGRPSCWEAANLE